MQHAMIRVCFFPITEDMTTMLNQAIAEAEQNGYRLTDVQSWGWRDGILTIALRFTLA